ncbi:MAG: chorismate synthase, partial [Rickettsiales bacterium]
MTFNTFGHLFRFTSWGESHGEAIGCVVDGVPSLIDLCEADIQIWLDKRKPAQSRYTTQRQESDTVKILSGVFEGKTTGAPISLIIHNEDQKSKDYGEIKDKFRPGHADYTYWEKYGIRDYRGGGRSSARETAMRVASGAIARKILGNSISIRGSMVQMGDDKIDSNLANLAEIDNNPFWCADAQAAVRWATKLDAIRKSGSSIGAVIEVVADGVPVGFGAPIYKKLDTDIASALMSINAVKAVEIGDGFASAYLSGEQNADCMRSSDGEVRFESNHAGGILGGISTGQQIVARFAVKPTSSILNEVNTIDIHGNNTTIMTKGRHDPCVVPRAVPIVEAMTALVLANLMLEQRA